MSASFEAVTYGKLFYEFIEIDEINALKRGNLMHFGGDKIYWWRQNILNSSRKMISAPTLDYIIHTDAGNLG